MALPGSRPNNRPVLFIGILCAILAFAGVLYLLKNSGGGDTVTVEAFAADEPAQTLITSDMLKQIQIPQASAPRDFFTDTSQIVGKQTVGNVTGNTVVVNALIQTPGQVAVGPNSNGLSITPGYVAVAIPTSVTIPATPANSAYAMQGGAGDLVSVGYYIHPEDHIDVLIANCTINGSSCEPFKVIYSFQDLRVLKVGDNAGTPAAGAAPAATTGAVFVVEVPRAQAELLTQLVMDQCNTAAPQASSCTAPIVAKYVLRPKCEYGDVNYPTDVKNLLSIPYDNYSKGLDANGRPLSADQQKALAAKLAQACLHPYPNYEPLQYTSTQPNTQPVPTDPPLATAGSDPGATVSSLTGLFH